MPELFHESFFKKIKQSQCEVQDVMLRKRDIETDSSWDIR